MNSSVHHARVCGPILYVDEEGLWRRIPHGPCLLMPGAFGSVDVVWGPEAQRCVAVSPGTVEQALGQGHLVRHLPTRSCASAQT